MNISEAWIRHSPTEHENGAGAGIVRQRQCLLQAQLLTATVKTIRAVDAFGVVIAARAILHGLQLFRTLFREERKQKVVYNRGIGSPITLSPPTLE